MRDLMTSTSTFSPFIERSGLSFSVVKSLILREKEKSIIGSYNEDIISLVLFLFNSGCYAELHANHKREFLIRLYCKIY